MSEKLKPCPFCKRKRIISEQLGSFGPVNEDPEFELWIVKCKCDAQVISEGKIKAEKAWNRRPK